MKSMRNNLLRHPLPHIYCGATRTKRCAGNALGPRGTGDDTMAYARIADDPHDLAATTARPKSRRGFFRRAFDAMVEARQRSAEREIALFLKVQRPISDRRRRTRDRAHPVFIGALLKPPRPHQCFPKDSHHDNPHPSRRISGACTARIHPRHCRRDGHRRADVRSVRGSRAPIVRGTQPLSTRRLTPARASLSDSIFEQRGSRVNRKLFSEQSSTLGTDAIAAPHALPVAPGAGRRQGRDRRPAVAGPAASAASRA